MLCEKSLEDLSQLAKTYRKRLHSSHVFPRSFRGFAIRVVELRPSSEISVLVSLSCRIEAV